MKNRIKLLRRTLDLTQQKFADRLGIKGNAISQYESGRNEPIDAVISLICREFNVNETWLRTGEGEMFRQRSREDELAEYMDSLMQSEPNDIRRKFALAVSHLSTAQLIFLKDIAEGLVADLQTTATDAEQIQFDELLDKPVIPESPAPDPDIEAQVELYRQHLIAKSKAISNKRIKNPSKMSLEEMQMELARQYTLEQDTADESLGFGHGNSSTTTG